MELIIYTTPQEFLAASEEALLREEAKNSLLMGIPRRLALRPELAKSQPFFAQVVEGGEAQLYAIMTPPFGIVLSSPHPEPVAAIDQLVDGLLAAGWTVPDASGPTPLGKLFAQTWAQRTGGDYEQEMYQRVYELRAVTPETLSAAPGRMRAGTPDDLDLIYAWRTAFELEAFGRLDSTEEDRRGFVERAHPDIVLWKDGGQVVSMAMQSRPTKNGITVNLVYTPEEQRRKGYATVTVAHLSQQLLDEGYQFCTLFTDLLNPTSNSIYLKIGYQPVCDFDKYRLLGIGG